GPFATADFAARYALPQARAQAVLAGAAAGGALIEGEFTPGGTRREWCDPDALTSIRQRSLAKLRRQVEPVEPAALGRLITRWQGVVTPRRGLDALLDSVEHLQGAALAASLLETAILPSRVLGYSPADLDTLIAAGEVVWTGVEPLGDRDGRVALFLADQIDRLWIAREASARGRALDPKDARILEYLGSEGASFFTPMHDAAGGGYPRDTLDALWSLVWMGLVTNDSMHALRAFLAGVTPSGRASKASRASAGRAAFRSRRMSPPAGAGRWSLVADRLSGAAKPTERSAALAQQLLQRYGVITRDVAAAEGIPGGFSAVYEVLRAMEDAGRIRRGYFVAGVAATQFAMPSALDTLRSLKIDPEQPEIVRLAAADPANPYGTLLKWPGERSDPGRGPTRTVGSLVVLVNGEAAAWIGRGRQILAWLPEDEPQRSVTGRAIAAQLGALGLLVTEISGVPAASHPLARYLPEAGYIASPMGYQMGRAERLAR
ncbi:MAG: DEAD/DEAH box helicase, partial [Acidobacteriota bacterium]|nr:DEAD/DEAH box helicase [Acidobacteriota bacterium]